MKRLPYSIVFFVAALGALASSACDNPNELTGGRGRPGSSNGGVDDPAAVAAALQCTQAPEGRSYVLFDGTKLEAARLNENIGVNRARVKPFAVMAREYERVLGFVPQAIKDASDSFDVPPARWYGESKYAAVSLHAIASASFEGCLEYTKTSASFDAPPTAETARTECTKLMRKAWSRSPSPDEISGCSELATVGLADETDAHRRWAYTCASVLSASQFLTF